MRVSQAFCYLPLRLAMTPFGPLEVRARGAFFQRILTFNHSVLSLPKSSGLISWDEMWPGSLYGPAVVAACFPPW